MRALRLLRSPSIASDVLVESRWSWAAWGRRQDSGGSGGQWAGGASAGQTTGWAAGLHGSAAARLGAEDSASVPESSAVDFSSTAEVAPASGAELHFTPDASAIGGTLIGLAAATKLGFTGRILGVSGIVGGLVRGDWSAWRVSWLGGLAAGALAASAVYPEGFYAFPETYTLARAACGGLLVGLGTSLGSGCTSGHGVCGISRLAPRSLMATATFMTSGAVTAAAAGSLAATGVDPSAATTLQLMNGSQWGLALPLLGGSLATVGGLRALGLVAGSGSSKRALELAAEFASGAIFAAGLALSGMVRPDKVVGFLSPLVDAWDPSLAFVMGGALAITVPTFQWMLRRGTGPLCSASFSLPTNKHIDAPLLVGSALFGAGWAVAGVCPGPALVAMFGAPSMHTATLVGAMTTGWLLHKPLQPVYTRLLGSAQSQAAAWEQAEAKAQAQCSRQ